MSLVCEIDMGKAYDQVDRSFLSLRMRFCEKMVLMGCGMYFNRKILQTYKWVTAIKVISQVQRAFAQGGSLYLLVFTVWVSS